MALLFMDGFGHVNATYGSDFILSQTLKAAMDIFEKEPTDDVAWNVTKVNAAEFGYKIQS